jgi:xylulokinase
MKRDGVALNQILAVSGSGQQHGSVYFNERITAALETLDSKKPLVENLKGVFARKTSPIWMDSSTAAECAEIRKKLGGIKYTASRTGSDTFERFTGPQIRKFYKTEPDAYDKTFSIALVSSFMASLLAGKIAPIDYGDGAGMNLMDIRNKVWSMEALKATAPSLKLKLPPLAPSGHVIGKVSAYFVNKYGLNPEALATTWTGDNPASVIGLGLIKPGQIAVSLGTSDTFFGTMEKCQTDENGEGHVFGSPTGGYMTLVCFKNGSLAREKIRELYGIKNWDEFGKLVAATKPGNGGGILLPWFEAEIVPRVNQPGIHRFDLDAKNAAANCRAIFEAQMLSMRLHSQWMNVSPEKIFATGGASNDLALLQIMADVMNCRVERIEVSKSAALGAALQAAHGWLAAADKNPKWEKLVAGFTAPIPGSEIRPDKNAARIYDKLIEKYARCECEALEQPGEM